MRLITHLCALLAISYGIVYKSMAQSTSASVSLNIILNPILELTIDPNQLSTSLIYNNANDYKDGVQVVNKEFLKISSTVPYVVYVQLVDDGFKIIEGDPKKNLTEEVVQVIANSVEPSSGLQYESPILSAENKSMITGTQIAFNKVFDVSYKGPGNNFFVDYLSKAGPTRFSSTLIYSIVPQ